MPYHHVIISLKDKKDVIDENFLEQELLNIIVKPLKNHEKFRCGDDFINLEDTLNIKAHAWIFLINVLGNVLSFSFSLQ